MLELEEARARILALIRPLPAETVSLDEAAGRVRLQAETKAQADLMLARKDAERILGEARLEAERILAAARLEAHDIDWQSLRQEVRPAQHPEAEWPAAPDVARSLRA